MSEQAHVEKERQQVQDEFRLATLERTVTELRTEQRKLSRLIFGNGEEGVFGQMRMSCERIEVLQRQYKWVLAILAALLAAAIRLQLVG